MRTFVLTNLERHILHEFLKSKTQQKGFKMLLHRIRKYHDALEDDLKLITEVKKITESMNL